MFDRRDFIGRAAAAVTSSFVPTWAQASPRQNEDIRLLEMILTTLHPGIYRYASPAGLQAGLAGLDQAWSKNPELEARFLALSQLLATLRCGHSYVNFFNQKQAVAKQLFDRSDLFPLAFRWEKEGMVVLQDQSLVPVIQRGSIVTAVNSVSTATILSRLLPLVRTDGSNNGKRRALLSVTGGDEIETFDAFYPLMFAPAGTGGYEIRYRAPGSTSESSVHLPGIDQSRRRSFQRSLGQDNDGPVWQWDMGTDGIAVLTMPGWALYNSKWNWQAWLDDRLDSLGGAKGVIIDLRENEGGNDCGQAILSRFAKRDIVVPSFERLVRYRQVPKTLDGYLDTWDDSFRNWGDRVEPYDDRFLRLTDNEDSGVIVPRGKRVTVPMVVLTSAQNSSSTFQFANLIKLSGLGRLVGAMTGGNRRGINGGAFFFARLPESGLEFDVPLIGYFSRERQPDAGIAPDIAVRNTASDFAGDYDRTLDAGRALILRS